MTKTIKTIKQAKKEIERLEKIIDESQNKIVDLAGFIKYEKSLQTNKSQRATDSKDNDKGNNKPNKRLNNYLYQKGAVSSCLECEKEFNIQTDILLCQDCMKLFDVNKLWKLHDNNKLDALDFNESEKFRNRFRKEPICFNCNMKYDYCNCNEGKRRRGNLL